MSKSDVVIQRHANRTAVVLLTDDIDTTEAIRFDLHEHSGFVLADLVDGINATYYVSADGETFYALNNASDAGIVQDVTDDTAYTFPDEAKPFPWIKLVLDDGTATLDLIRKA